MLKDDLQEYEENPWEDEPIVGKVVTDLLPAPKELAKSVFRIRVGEQDFFTFPKDDMIVLSAIAKKRGETTDTLLENVIHDYISDMSQALNHPDNSST